MNLTKENVKSSSTPLSSPSLVRSLRHSSLKKEKNENYICETEPDYKKLYEKEKQEKEVCFFPYFVFFVMIYFFSQKCEAKLKELEKHLETGFQSFIKLRKVLCNLHDEIESSDETINEFIQVKSTYYVFSFYSFSNLLPEHSPGFPLKGNC